MKTALFAAGAIAFAAFKRDAISVSRQRLAAVYPKEAQRAQRKARAVCRPLPFPSRRQRA